MGGLWSRVAVRWVLEADFEGIESIERHSFEQRWSGAELRGVLRTREAAGVVVEVNRRLAGYMFYELHPSRVEVLTIAVEYRSRRLGCGTALLGWLKARMTTERQRMETVVRERNLSAQLFLRSQGFRAERVLRGYFADTDEEAYQMVYRQMSRMCNA